MDEPATGAQEPRETAHSSVHISIQVLAWLLGALAVLTLLDSVAHVIAVLIGDVGLDGPLDAVSIAGTFALALATLPTALGLWRGWPWASSSAFVLLAVQVPQLVTPFGILAVFLFVEVHVFMGPSPDVQWGINVVPVVLGAALALGGRLGSRSQMPSPSS